MTNIKTLCNITKYCKKIMKLLIIKHSESWPPYVYTCETRVATINLQVLREVYTRSLIGEKTNPRVQSLQLRPNRWVFRGRRRMPTLWKQHGRLSRKAEALPLHGTFGNLRPGRRFTVPMLQKVNPAILHLLLQCFESPRRGATPGIEPITSPGDLNLPYG